MTGDNGILRTLGRRLAAPGWHGLTWRQIAKVAVPLALLGIGEVIYSSWVFGEWVRFFNDLIWITIAVWLAVVFPGRWRDVMTAASATLLCIAGVEAFALVSQSRAVPIIAGASRHYGENPVLGWRATLPGPFRHWKRQTASGRVLFDVIYTFDQHLERRVISAEDGPTIAFFGDSGTFGEGLPDAETLPQLFADITDRRLHVVNLAGSGYGPQQFLRPVETGFFDDVLGRPRAFVFLTAPWDMDRTACVANYVMQAPRYQMVDGTPHYVGKCADRWWFIGRLFTMTMYKTFLEPTLLGPSREKMELYVAMLARAGAVARERYGVPTVIPYIPTPYYLAGSGITDDQIMARLRASGLTVVDAGLDQNDFPGQPLAIEGEGHPTGTANRARAALVLRTLGDLGVLSK